MTERGGLGREERRDESKAGRKARAGEGPNYRSRPWASTSTAQFISLAEANGGA